MIQKRICTKCKEIKPFSEFGKRKLAKDGLRHVCKVCEVILTRDYQKTKNGLVTRIYSQQKSNSKLRGHNPPNYTKQELKEWLYSQKRFHELYSNWVASGYESNLSPSCDRTENAQCYSLERLLVMTWKQNRENAYTDIRSGKLVCTHKPVIGTHKITGEIIEFVSLNQAERETGILANNIGKCCLEKKHNKSAGEYFWKFKQLER